METFVGRELRYIAIDRLRDDGGSRAASEENYLKEMALDSLDAIEERRSGICAKIREPKS
ncbi:hypothetical protein QUB47_31380 [Microcoleus sp. AT9_B5]